jgi:decaprenyl-phosphate phosphoribosyltransferase
VVGLRRGPEGEDVADHGDGSIRAGRQEDATTVLSRQGEDVAAGPRRIELVRALFVTARPRQWAKNVLVFGAPATGGVLLELEAFAKAAAAFLAFGLVASGLYFVNDIVDRVADRAHPRKQFRPIAAGNLSMRLATAFAALLIVGGMAVAVWSSGLRLGAVVGAYLTLALSYTFVLRSIVLVDLAAVAGGFVLRAVAGGVAVDVPLSSWFLLVACFGALFIATGKRRAEHGYLGQTRGDHRKTLDQYSESYLRYVMSSTSTVTIAAYCLWAFEGEAGRSLPAALSILPFVLGIYRYAMLLDAGWGGAPEDIVLRDRPLLLCGLSWVLFVGIGVYLR